MPPKAEAACADAVAQQAVLGVPREGTAVGIDWEVAVSGQTALV